MEIDLASFGRAILFLGIPFVLLVFYLQWRWAKTCDANIQVLIAKLGGGGKFELAPREGGQVSIYNPYTDEARTWPVNELATIDVTYPGVGFVPKFLQKTIRLAVVNEGDWEPMLNRSPHRQKIASPDVVKFLLEIADKNPKLRSIIKEFTDDLSTGPTREMVADPATLGSLIRNSVLRALASVSNELMDTLKNINTRLARFAGLNGTVIYIGLGLTAILAAFLVYQTMQIINLLDAIHKTLGITGAG